MTMLRPATALALALVTVSTAASAQDAYEQRFWPMPVIAVNTGGTVQPALVFWVGPAQSAPFELSATLLNGPDCDAMLYPNTGAEFLIYNPDGSLHMSGVPNSCMTVTIGDTVRAYGFIEQTPPVPAEWYGLAVAHETVTPRGMAAEGDIAVGGTRSFTINPAGGPVTYTIAPGQEPITFGNAEAGAQVAVLQGRSELLIVVPSNGRQLQYFSADYSSVTLRATITP